MLEELSVLSGKRLWVPGPGLPVSVVWVHALPVDSIRGAKGEIYFGYMLVLLINPRRCVAQQGVTVIGLSVCVCVCLCV